MQKFFNNENEQIIHLISQLGEALNKYNNKDLDASNSLLLFLDNGLQVYKTLAQPDKETWLQKLKADFITAQRGINPETFDKPTLGKREMQYNVQLRIMQNAEAQLKQDYEKNLFVLKQAEDLIGQIIIMGFQTGIFADGIIKNIKTQTDIETAWQLLSKDANINLGQKRLLLMVSRFDVWILISDALSKIE